MMAKKKRKAISSLVFVDEELYVIIVLKSMDEENRYDSLYS